MTARKRGRSNLYQLVVLLDREDRKALDTIVLHEKLTRSDVIRRSIRALARKLDKDPSTQRAA